MKMVQDKPVPSRKPSTRERVLDAAGRLLAKGDASFSMRELAEEAAVSFATPFNQFGGKGAIMLALSARRIAAMHARFTEETLPASAADRVLLATGIAASVMLSAPAVNRAVMGAIGAPSDETRDVSTRSSELWAKAIGDGRGFSADTQALALAVLPDQLAIAFRGVLSFWTAGEIPDQSLARRAEAAAATTLLGFVEQDERARLLALL